jgi:hypothetical protein
MNNHNHLDCRNRNKREFFKPHGPQQSKKPRVKCTYCHYQNHIYEDCRTRKRHEQEASTSQKQEQNNSVAHLASKQKEVSDSEMFNLEHAFVSFRLGKLQADDWFADSASTEHMTEHRHYFTSFEPISHKWNMKGVGRDNQPLEVKGKGDIKIKITVGTNVHYQILQDVLYVPSIDVNLFSIGKATDREISAIFKKDSVRMYRVINLELIGTRSKNDLYQLNMLAVSPESLDTSSSSQTVPGTNSLAFPAVPMSIMLLLRKGKRQILSSDSDY